MVAPSVEDANATFWFSVYVPLSTDGVGAPTIPAALTVMVILVVSATPFASIFSGHVPYRLKLQPALSIPTDHNYHLLYPM